MTVPAMRIAIFGSGGVGGYFGARLHQGGEHVAFIARGKHLEAMRSGGLRITSHKGDATLPSVTATDDPSSIGPVDVVLVAVKTWQLPEAIDGTKSLMGDGTFVVPALNGVEAADELAAGLGTDSVLIGLCRIIAHIEEPGHIRHVGAEPYVAFGERDNVRSERAERFRSVLEHAGVSAEIPDDIEAALWHKFMFVVSTGGVGSVTRAPIGTLRTVPETRALLEGAMREIERVARARGVRLPDDIVPKSMVFLDTLPAEGRASLSRDLAEGRRSELEAWNGAVVRLGREVGVPTPIHEMAYASLLPLELRALGKASFD